jgi:3'-phosphoadenosine 5'-phosphosulfate sulfotransferase (PAPS reductase)/FAD synthetase
MTETAAATAISEPALPGMNRAVPDLASFDVILINSSAGKDSQAMLSRVVSLVDAADVDRSRIVVVHDDLGRVEWAGTRELAERQAAAYGLRFEVVHRTKGDLLDQIEERGMFPSSTARYCTSDQKTAQVLKLMTRLAAQHRQAQAQTGVEVFRPIRILNCLGMRAQESPARAKKSPFGRDKQASNGRREVTRWLPIFDWTIEQVWATIRESGLPYHSAYDAGMPRLSCVLCVLAGRKELVIGARLNPDLTREYVALEARIGHTFKANLSIAEIAAEAGVLNEEPAA